MLRRLKELEHWAVLSREGDDLGAVQDFYFDDERWTVRYVVVKAARWFTGRLVLLSPMSLDQVQWDQAVVVSGLTRKQIESAPDADLAMPVSRRWEAAYAGYYAIPYYWSGTGVWGDWPTPSEARLALREPVAAPSADGEHLRSTRAVTGYHLQAIDGEIERLRRAGCPPTVLSVHSFTPRLNVAAKPRPWHIGVMHSYEPALADFLIAAFSAVAGIVVGRNEPYSGFVHGYAQKRHGLAQGLPHAQLEIRQDLIGDDAGQDRWAGIVAEAMSAWLSKDASEVANG